MAIWSSRTKTSVWRRWAYNLLPKTGTFTVEFYDAASDGNASSSTTTGYYTKIGDLVFVNFGTIQDISTTGMTGANSLYMSMPFAASATGGRAVNAAIWDNVDTSGTDSRPQITAYTVLGSDRVRFRATGDNIADGAITVEDLSDGVSDMVRCSMVYKTDE